MGDTAQARRNYRDTLLLLIRSGHRVKMHVFVEKMRLRLNLLVVVRAFVASRMMERQWHGS